MKAVIALSVIAAAMTSTIPAQGITGSARTLMEIKRPPTVSETAGDLLLIRQRAPSTAPQAPQFDPPSCVSGADTYCQPIGSSPPPAKLPANIPQ